MLIASTMTGGLLLIGGLFAIGAGVLLVRYRWKLSERAPEWSPFGGSSEDFLLIFSIMAVVAVLIGAVWIVGAVIAVLF